MLVHVLVSKTHSMRSKSDPSTLPLGKYSLGGSPSFVVYLYQAWGSLFVSAADRVASNFLNLAQPSLGLPAAMICRSLGMEVVTETSVENALLGLSTISCTNSCTIDRSLVDCGSSPALPILISTGHCTPSMMTLFPKKNKFQPEKSKLCRTCSLA